MLDTPYSNMNTTIPTEGQAIPRQLSGHTIHYTIISQHSLLGLPVSEELILQPPAGLPAVRLFYSSFDWLDYGLILLVN
jgi:hypothetical protein